MTASVQHARVIRKKLLDRCRSAGVATVQGFEPASAPIADKKVFCAVVNGPGRTVPQGSTLSGTSVWQSYIIYLYLKLPIGQDQKESLIDPKVSDARDTLLDVIHNPINYGNQVELDPLGAYGEPIRWAPGYFEQEGTKYRAETITPGFIAWNVWDQVRT